MTEAEVEIVHKIVTDPGRVTKTWVDQQLAKRLGVGALEHGGGGLRTLAAVQRGAEPL